MDIATIVRRLVRIHGANDPFKIAKEKGIIVLSRPLEEINGYYIKSRNIRFIVLNSALPCEERTFVCAHELGHAILHPNEPALSRINQKNIKVEAEANRFATLLLINGSHKEYALDSIYEILQYYGIKEEMEDYIT